MSGADARSAGTLRLGGRTGICYAGASSLAVAMIKLCRGTGRS